jgi:hypothetical protein
MNLAAPVVKQGHGTDILSVWIISLSITHQPIINKFAPLISICQQQVIN